MELPSASNSQQKCNKWARSIGLLSEQQLGVQPKRPCQDKNSKLEDTLNYANTELTRRNIGKPLPQGSARGVEEPNRVSLDSARKEGKQRARFCVGEGDHAGISEEKMIQIPTNPICNTLTQQN
ncbi:hypothetical protein Lal_00037632 [Lupinus albus]|nr:hypothetical protein Lal_00037632 [Lupinus albus]